MYDHVKLINHTFAKKRSPVNVTKQNPVSFIRGTVAHYKQQIWADSEQKRMFPNLKK